jgi:hypothetical protein
VTLGRGALKLSRCPSRDSPAASSPPRRGLAAAAVKKAPRSAASGECSTETTRNRNTAIPQTAQRRAQAPGDRAADIGAAN